MSVVAESTPPDKPGDGDDPPDGPGGGGGGGGGGGETPPDKPGEGGGGGSEDAVALTGAYQYVGETNALAGATLESVTADQNVVLAQSNAYVTVSNCALNKSGDTSSEDNSNFYALNAAVAAKTAATICIDSSELNANAVGANCLFASGSGSTIYAYGCALTSTKDSSRGLDATYEGTVIASKLTIDTAGSHCASLATDRGNGRISVTDATLSTAGQGSPLIYSTGVIEVNGVTGTATGAQIAGIEGLSTIRIRNSVLTGSAEKASESVPNGVIIYQSNSGDSAEGTATFEVSDSTLTSTISSGALFYVTHSAAVITVRNTALDFDADANYLVLAAGNNGENGWGTVGSNGAEVVFTAIDQTLKGTISVDGISTLDLYLTNSTYTGTFDTTNAAAGVNVFIGSDSTWTVTESCTLDTLTVSDGATIRDGDGKSVSIVESGETRVPGSSAITIAVSDYVSGTFATTNVTAFEIGRTAFDAKYGTSQDSGGGSGGSGGAADHNNWTNYFKPYPPENAIVKVKAAGAADYGTPDRDHKYCLDGYWDGNAENGIEVRILYKTKEGYLFADGGITNIWYVTVTNNAQEVYPPEGVVAIKARARCGSTDYLTLKAAVDAAQPRARVVLTDSDTLDETLTATNSIAIDLNTNTVTLGSALTNAFRFTAGATVSNGTIKSSLAANAAGSVLMRFTDCRATLQNLTVDGRGYETVVAHDSANGSAKEDAVTGDGLTLAGNGCLLSVDHAKTVLTNGCSFTVDGDLASFGEHQAAIYSTGGGTVSIVGGTYVAPAVLLSDDFGVFFKSDDVIIAAPDGYVWEGGRLVAGTPPDAVAAGVTGDAYADAQAAASAAAAINANKADCIVVPTGVEGAAKSAYLSRVSATVTGDNRIVVDLTAAAETEVQSAVDGAVTNETAVASLTSGNASAKVTVATTTPGLYYWIDGGTDVNAVTNAGAGVLSTDGGSVELGKPTLDAAKGRAFFRISAGVSAPLRANATANATPPLRTSADL